jgi:hypothetical protein
MQIGGSIMNQIGIISLLAFLVAASALYVAAYAAAVKLRPLVQGRLAVLIDRLFPALKMDAWLFEPIAAANLPPDQREFMEAHTPDFVARQFTLLGDFVLRRDREPSCVRPFLSPDRTVLGELSCFLGDHVVGAISVLFDGTYLETSTVRLDQPPPKEHGLRFFSHPTKSALDLLDHHAACVAQTVFETCALPAVLEPSEFQAVMNYGRQLSLRSLHQQGVLHELPDFLRRNAPAGPKE